jgi:hypothetical protein
VSSSEYTRDEILESLLNCLCYVYKTDPNALQTIEDLIQQAEDFCFGPVDKELH